MIQTSWISFYHRIIIVDSHTPMQTSEENQITSEKEINVWLQAKLEPQRRQKLWPLCAKTKYSVCKSHKTSIPLFDQRCCCRCCFAACQQKSVCMRFSVFECTVRWPRYLLQSVIWLQRTWLTQATQDNFLIEHNKRAQQKQYDWAKESGEKRPNNKEEKKWNQNL